MYSVFAQKKKKKIMYSVLNIVFCDLLTHKITTHNNIVWAAAS